MTLTRRHRKTPRCPPPDGGDRSPPGLVAKPLAGEFRMHF